MFKCIYILEKDEGNLNNSSSIYLGGPTYRDKQPNQKSWREGIQNILKEKGFDGILYIPEWRDNIKPKEWTYSRQISWETDALNKSSVILFWIPRDLVTLPGFTTNIEFGEWFKSGKIVIGSPETSPKNEYLKERCARENIIWSNNLQFCVEEALNKLKSEKEPKVWITADTHFGEERTRELSKRPFANCFDMDNFMINEWNRIVRKNDIVYHLGDFGDINVIGKLNYNKIYLLLGNYDKSLEIGYNKRIVCIERNHIVSYNGMEFKLIHEPEFAVGEGFYLFGHIHKLQMVKKNGLNIGVDCHNFRPIGWDTILFYKNAIEKHYDRNVFIEKLGENKEL